MITYKIFIFKNTFLFEGYQNVSKKNESNVSQKE
jgi:hypothetical protein